MFSTEHFNLLYHPFWQQRKKYFEKNLANQAYVAANQMMSLSKNNFEQLA